MEPKTIYLLWRITNFPRHQRELDSVYSTVEGAKETVGTLWEWLGYETKDRGSDHVWLIEPRWLNQ